ncbi:MAG TPA: hypothetical protein VGT24_02680 [Candidatus Acidoferrales bacterium]|nr:hypothetical protein [Candidatus Acidoferrales bacterium]
MSGFELRPLSLGELLDRAFMLYRRNFWLFAGVMAVPTCLVIPMRFFYLRSRGVLWYRASPQSHSTAHAFSDLFGYWIIYSVVQAATTYAVADAYLGRNSTVWEAYGRIRGRFWRVIGVTLNVGIRVFGLMSILVFLFAAAGGFLAAAMNPGNASIGAIFFGIILGLIFVGFLLALWYSLRYSVTLPAVLLEDIKGSTAIRRSVQLSRGRRGQIFVAMLLGIVVYYAAAILFQGPFYAGIAIVGIKELPSWLAFAISVSGSIGGVVAGPLLMIVTVLLYYDLRIRKEAFDLQQMMSLLPEPTPVDSSPRL